jgi:5-methylcytosine-specific restriction endonuclease McrA
MLKNTGLKRFPIKYIRDRAKSAYVKENSCYVCEATDKLELHHVCSISELFKRWCSKAGVVIDSLDDILAHRDKFIEEHNSELYEQVRTLCSVCHKRLHMFFGQHPPLQMAPKQLLWLDKLKGKRRSDG